MYDFTYNRPTTVADAVKMLGGVDAKALAGGHTFIPVLKQRLNKPSVVVDLQGLSLSSIEVANGRVTLGAMTPHGEVADSEAVQEAFPALAYMANMIGDHQVRHRGTIGGSLANNDPSACYPAAVLGTNATIRTDRREILADDYFQGMFTTALAPDELIVGVSFPVPRKAAYTKFRNPASRYAMVGVFVADGPAGVRVAVTGAGQGGVFRHTAAEQALAKGWSVEAVADVHTDAADMNSDIHGSAAYRAHLVGVMIRRAVAATL